MSQSFYIHSDSGESCFLARRLVDEGHRVKMFIKAPRSRMVGQGWAPRVNVFAPAKSDVVIFDMVGDGVTADSLRRKGYKVIGGSQFADVHEIDREQGHLLMRHIGISLPLTRTFTSVGEAKKFLNDQEDSGWFYKPAGDADANLTYGSIDRVDMLDWLDYVRKGEFELQKKVEGSEISIEGWFDGSHWVHPFNSTVEDKKFMAGDVGANTGCSGNIVWGYKDSRPTLALRTITRLENILAEVGYCGPIDLNMIIDKEGEPQGLEWTNRFGYDALAALCMLNVGDLGEQLGSFASGTLDEFEIATDVMAMTIRVTMPPYPNWKYAKDVMGMRVDPGLMNQHDLIFPQDIMVKDGKPMMAGSDASVAVFGTKGKDPTAMRNVLLKKIKKFRIKDAQYKTDLGDRYYKVAADLNKFHYDMFSGELP